MSSNAPGLDDALNRLVTILQGGSTPPISGQGTGLPIIPSGGPGTGTSTPKPPVATTPPITDVEQRAELARIQLYLQGMPILTDDKIAELEASLPELIALLESLGYRPSLKRQVSDLVGGGKGKGERSQTDDARLAAFAKIVQSDMGASGERVAPLALALFMAAYTVVKQWKA